MCFQKISRNYTAEERGISEPSVACHELFCTDVIWDVCSPFSIKETDQLSHTFCCSLPLCLAESLQRPYQARATGWQKSTTYLQSVGQ